MKTNPFGRFVRNSNHEIHDLSMNGRDMGASPPASGAVKRLAHTPLRKDSVLVVGLLAAPVKQDGSEASAPLTRVRLHELIISNFFAAGHSRLDTR